MSKQTTIKIDKCIDCPFCSESCPDIDVCFHEDSPGKEQCIKIEDVFEIPEWCPLKEYEEEQTCQKL